MIGLFLKAVVGAIVWAVANVVYYDMKRKGVHGFTRFAAFWAGTPTTWITFFVAPEGRVHHFNTQDDDAGLLAEVKRDRARREALGLGPGSEGEDR